MTLCSVVSGPVPGTRSLPGALCDLPQRRFSLGQPERHVHGAVELDGSRKCNTGLLPLTGLHIQRAKAAVAVSLEGAHAQLLGQGEGLAVGGCGQLKREGSTLRVDDAEQPQGPRLLASQVLLRSMCEGTFGELDCLLS